MHTPIVSWPTSHGGSRPSGAANFRNDVFTFSKKVSRRCLHDVVGTILHEGRKGGRWGLGRVDKIIILFRATLLISSSLVAIVVSPSWLLSGRVYGSSTPARLRTSARARVYRVFRERRDEICSWLRTSLFRYWNTICTRCVCKKEIDRTIIIFNQFSKMQARNFSISRIIETLKIFEKCCCVTYFPSIRPISKYEPSNLTWRRPLYVAATSNFHAHISENDSRETQQTRIRNNISHVYNQKYI